jgi:transposase
MAKRKVTDEVFIREYMKGGNQADIGARLGLRQSSVSLRAARLRRHGVALPSPPRASKLNRADYIAKLNAIISGEGLDG